MRQNKNLCICVLLLVSTLVSLPQSLPAQAKNDALTRSFRFWLLNNEARAMSALKADRLLAAKLSLPFAFMPFEQPTTTTAAEEIWVIHHKFYRLLDELQAIYDLASIFGSGRFGIVFKQHRPEIWAVLPLQTALPSLSSLTAVAYRKAFHIALLKVLSIDAERDADLSNRLQRAVKILTDEEFRLFSDYLTAFSALYPSENSGRAIASFIENGSRQQFATGLKDFLQPVFAAPVDTDISVPEATPETEDYLSELEKIIGTDENSKTSAADSETELNVGTESALPQSTGDLEPAQDNAEDPFKIWD